MSILGAIIGDIMGSRYEFANTFDYDFEPFGAGCSFTDDTVCTVAIADAILRNHDNPDYKGSTLNWCRKYPYPMGAYGGSFSRWLRTGGSAPYGSFGNGAAMRVSPVGFAFADDPERIEMEAEASAAFTHNHPEGIKGAKCVAGAIGDLVRGEGTAAEVALRWREKCYKGYPLPIEGEFDETCQGCVPLALTLLTESNGYEDAVRRAVSYGGDSDTLGAVVGSLAAAAWDIPEWMVVKAKGILPADLLAVVEEFDKNVFYSAGT